MALYLVQHGLSASKQEDPRKGLTNPGRAQTERIARVAADYRLSVSMIMHSGKLRAQQTADIMAEALKPEEGVHMSSGMGPLDDVASFAKSLDMAADRMLVGHLPFMERLIAFLVTGRSEPVIMKMQNSGIVCLDVDTRTVNPVITWTLMPQIG